MIDLPDALFYVALTISPVVLAFILRRRIAKWFYRTALEAALSDLFTFEDQDIVQDGKTVRTRVMAPTARLDAFLKGVVPGLLASVLKSAKLALPKNLAGMLPEGANLGEALGPMLGGLLRPYMPPGTKALAPQVGTILGGKLNPYLEKFLGGFGAVGTETKPGVKPGTKQVIPRELEL